MEPDTNDVDPQYMQALESATSWPPSKQLLPTWSQRNSIARIATDPRAPIVDKRKPIVIDEDIRALLNPNDSVIGTLVNFGIHVELAWDRNLLLTADIAGYLRQGISEGIYYDGELRKPGLGGTTLWLHRQHRRSYDLRSKRSCLRRFPEKHHQSRPRRKPTMPSVTASPIVLLRAAKPKTNSPAALIPSWQFAHTRSSWALPTLCWH